MIEMMHWVQDDKGNDVIEVIRTPDYPDLTTCYTIDPRSSLSVVQVISMVSGDSEIYLTHDNEVSNTINRLTNKLKQETY